MDFSNWTRADFLAFDARRGEVFKPTPEETAAFELARKNAERARIDAKLSAVGVTRPETVTVDFCVALLERLGAQQFVGEDLRGWVANQETLFGDLDTAFDKLVDRFL